MKLRILFRLVEPLPVIIVLVVALPFLFIGIWETVKAQSMIKNFTSTQGTVIGNDYLSTTDPEDSAKVSWAYYPIVRFAAQGRQFSFTDGVGTYPSEYEVGDEVEVLYNPEDPYDATIKSWKRVWFGPIWITTIGLLPILGLIGWTVWQYVRGERMLRESRSKLRL
jgi:hypothetical protein